MSIRQSENAVQSSGRSSVPQVTAMSNVPENPILPMSNDTITQPMHMGSGESTLLMGARDALRTTTSPMTISDFNLAPQDAVKVNLGTDISILALLSRIFRSVYVTSLSITPIPTQVVDSPFMVNTAFVPASQNLPATQTSADAAAAYVMSCSDSKSQNVNNQWPNCETHCCTFTGCGYQLAPQAYLGNSPALIVQLYSPTGDADPRVRLRINMNVGVEGFYIQTSNTGVLTAITAATMSSQARAAFFSELKSLMGIPTNVATAHTLGGASLSTSAPAVLGGQDLTVPSDEGDDE